MKRDPSTYGCTFAKDHELAVRAGVERGLDCNHYHFSAMGQESWRVRSRRRGELARLRAIGAKARKSTN